MARRPLHRGLYQYEPDQANELKSYWDLLDPKWKGKIVSQDLRIGSARNQMYAIYVREDLGPKYLTRRYSEMDITISRSLPQISELLSWLGVRCERALSRTTG